MKKSLVICFCLVLILSLSLVSASWFGDFFGEITGKAVDNETEASNETEAEECAASISINFNQDVYRFGDTAKIVIEIFDSQGNGLSNYPFHLRIYSYSEDRWDLSEYPDPEYTNEQGDVEYSSMVDYIPEGDTEKILYKVYTQETSSCAKVEDTAEIEFRAKETEEEAESESAEPETCASEIDITFDKELYYIGDTAKIVIRVLDSQGNGLSNYLFYNQMYDGIWHTPGEQKTDESGYFRTQPTVEKEQSTIGKIKFKVYTIEYSNCNSIEDITEIEIREKEELEPVPCGIGTCIPEEEEEPEEIPEEKIFYKCNGCELEGKCYPMGYRKEGKYCSDNNEFIEQLGAGTCDNSFECKSNVCISGECVEEGLIKKILNWFKKLFGGEEDDEEPGLKMCSKLLIEKDIGDYEYFISEYGNKDAQVALYSENGEQIDIVKCCVAGYLEPDGEAKGTAGVVCPFDNKKDVENTLYWLSNKGEIILGEYKGQEVYGAGNAIIWTHKDFILAAGTDPKASIPFPDDIADAYLDKYPNEFGEIEIPVDECETITDTALKELCYIDVAIGTKDSGICERKIIDPARKDSCYLNVGQITKDITPCEKIIDSIKKNDCYTNVAVYTNDATLCEKITDSSIKENCYVLVQESIYP